MTTIITVGLLGIGVAVVGILSDSVLTVARGSNYSA
jgi:hypothetical protein